MSAFDRSSAYLTTQLGNFAGRDERAHGLDERVPYSSDVLQVLYGETLIKGLGS